ncbi:GFA family protein [Bradyrhizobium septentrionale]|uniref:GFA family protein n=1 Tax=Bradyrhizobium septentrionale TaxID=1404411 RepID=UPI001AEDE0DC|nr:GFA family protein [Bradyrhizobium septentrionale]UGY17716.1 GFA family protein [Bradyrhizobium septentrionale]UGY26452.1 GFA family protein [Bradyrhizobium septentrionale]
MIDELTTCDCSLCRRRNALMTKVHESELVILGGRTCSRSVSGTLLARSIFSVRVVASTRFIASAPRPIITGSTSFALRISTSAHSAFRATDGEGMSVIEATARPEWPGPRTPQ